MKTFSELQAKLVGVWALLDERMRRLMAANEARVLGRGGISEVSRACGLARKAIAKGMREIEAGTAPPPGRVRQPGAGRKKITAQDPGLMPALERLIEPETRGDPESPLRWTCKGTPVISVDTKKKELVGNYENKGRQWLPAKKPVKVQGHDFPHPDVPRAYPYGVYDLERNTGFVNVGTGHATGAFAVASIRGWWRHEGRRLYSHASHLLITADGGGSNGSRVRLWELGVQKLGGDTGPFHFRGHFPPGPGQRD